MKTVVKYVALVLGTILVLSGGNPALAYTANTYFCEGGQQPVPPAVAEQLALPLCGFAAIKRWTPNGCQLCDSRNMYPNPFAARSVPQRRAYEYR